MSFETINGTAVGQIGQKAGRGTNMKLKLLLLYGILATYGRIQMTEIQKEIGRTCVPPNLVSRTKGQDEIIP